MTAEHWEFQGKLIRSAEDPAQSAEYPAKMNLLWDPDACWPIQLQAEVEADVDPKPNGPCEWSARSLSGDLHVTKCVPLNIIRHFDGQGFRTTIRLNGREARIKALEPCDRVCCRVEGVSVEPFTSVLPPTSGFLPYTVKFQPAQACRSSMLTIWFEGHELQEPKNVLDAADRVLELVSMAYGCVAGWSRADGYVNGNCTWTSLRAVNVFTGGMPLLKVPSSENPEHFLQQTWRKWNNMKPEERRLWFVVYYAMEYGWTSPYPVPFLLLQAVLEALAESELTPESEFMSFYLSAKEDRKKFREDFERWIEKALLVKLSREDADDFRTSIGDKTSALLQKKTARERLINLFKRHGFGEDQVAPIIGEFVKRRNAFAHPKNVSYKPGDQRIWSQMAQEVKGLLRRQLGYGEPATSPKMPSDRGE